MLAKQGVCTKSKNAYEPPKPNSLPSEVNMKKPFVFLLLTAIVCALATAQRKPILEFELYRLEPTKTPPKQTLALHEPPIGTYLGAYVEQEPDIGLNKMFRITFLLNNNHAIYFRYHRLIRPEEATEIRPIFPDKFVAAAHNSGAAVHLAYEPAIPMREITEEIVRPFAEAARDSETPIFLRFASEFNDLGNEWSRDSKLYIEKFRLVSKVMREVAPNVAMVWSPMAYRLNVIDSYYPGKEYVDWVGVNFYNTIFVNGDPKQPGWAVHPLNLLEPIYKKYSQQHPIQISEYAAAHHVGSDTRDFSEFAIAKMRALYYGVMLKYPRVKNINYFSVDTINDDPKPNKRSAARLSNYSLLDNEVMRKVYVELFKQPHFLQFVLREGEQLEKLPDTPRPFPRLISKKAGLVRGASWVYAEFPITKVEYLLNNKPLSSSNALPFEFQFDPSKLSGSQTLNIRARDKAGKVFLERTVKFDVQ